MTNGVEQASESETMLRAEDLGNVVMLTGSYPPMPCGVGDSAHELARALAYKGVRIEVLTDAESDAGWKAGAPADAPSPDVPFHASVTSWGFLGLKRLARRVEELAPDIVHIHYPTKAYGRGLGVPLLPMLIRARRRRVERLSLDLAQARSRRFRVVVTLHEFKISHPARRLASFVLLDASDAVCMPCPLELAALKRRHISVEEKIHAAIPVGPVGPSPDEVTPEDRAQLRKRVREEWGVDDDDVVLLHYGIPTPSKGLEVLFKALRLLKLEGLTPLLVVVGDHRPKKDDFHKLVQGQPRGLGVHDQVRWLGRIPTDDLPGAFLAADIGVFPFLDGYSFRRSSLTGVLVWDLPIITTEPDGDLLQVPGQEKVRFCAVNDPRSLATALITLVANPKALELAKSVPNPLKERFRWESIAEQYLEIYRQVLEKT